MSQKTDIYFHVGLPRTASTFLQRKVFPQFKGILFVKKHDFKKHDQIIANATKPVLLSTEIDIGKGRPNANKLFDFAEKYPEAKIILVLRRHDKWIASKYKYHIRKNGNLTFREFFNLKENNGFFRREHLEYRKIIELLESIFQQKPLVMFQEEFKTAPEKSLNYLAEFCKADFDYRSLKTSGVNTAFSEKQLRLLWQFNRRFTFDEAKHGKVEKKIRAGLIHTLAFLARFIPSRKSNALIPESDLQEIQEAYKEDWQACINYVSAQRGIFF
ncbi:MAG: sulfotransferase [Bacteroidales bacterium]